MTPEEFKKARYALGLKQTELALALETPYRTVQDWESGRNRIPGVAAVALRLLQERDRWVTERAVTVTREQFERDLKGRVIEKERQPEQKPNDAGKIRQQEKKGRS